MSRHRLCGKVLPTPEGKRKKALVPIFCGTLLRQPQASVVPHASLLGGAMVRSADIATTALRSAFFL